MNLYQINHYYDMTDKGVFIKMPNISLEEVVNLAVYVQFKAEEILDETITLSNMTVVQFLWLQGAKILNDKPKESSEIDMYIERSKKCQDQWYHNGYAEYDKKYGEQATIFLTNKAKGKTLSGGVI